MYVELEDGRGGGYVDQNGCYGKRPFGIQVVVGRVKVIVRVRRQVMVGFHRVRCHAWMVRMIKAAWHVGMAG